tara:strand:+ start:2342 stop:2449 length:108 start_codon:yes stop_codon:yes gene_type:complete
MAKTSLEQWLQLDSYPIEYTIKSMIMLENIVWVIG